MQYKLFLLFFYFIFGVGVAQAAEDKEIPCTLRAIENGCSKCFDGGFLREGIDKTSLYTKTNNRGTSRMFVFAKENTSGAVTLLSFSRAVKYTQPDFDFSPNLFKQNFEKFKEKSWIPVKHPESNSTEWAAIIDPTQSVSVFETKANKELFVVNVDRSQLTEGDKNIIQKENFILKYKLKTWLRDRDEKKWEGSEAPTICQTIGVKLKD